MDKSEKYIRMCKGAREIQARWTPAYGDFYLGDNEKIACWLDRQPSGCRIRGGFKIDGSDNLITLSRCVWLPRQDQLIELAQVRGRTYDNVVLDFFNWTKQPYTPETSKTGKAFPSMEQIWLAYVMHRKFLKKWVDERWGKAM